MSGLVDGKRLVWLIAVVSGVAVVVHYLLFEKFRQAGPGDPRLLWELATSGATAAGVFYFVFRKWLWRLKIFRGWLVMFPDLSGTWHATIKSETFGGSHVEEVKIDHTFEKLIYLSKADGSRNAGTASHLVRTDQNQLLIFIPYKNEPSIRRAEFGFEHHGCLRLTLHHEYTEDPILDGHYWTDKPRSKINSDDKGTWGRVRMQLKQL